MRLWSLEATDRSGNPGQNLCRKIPAIRLVVSLLADHVSRVCTKRISTTLPTRLFNAFGGTSIAPCVTRKSKVRWLAVYANQRCDTVTIDYSSKVICSILLRFLAMFLCFK